VEFAAKDRFGAAGHERRRSYLEQRRTACIVGLSTPKRPSQSVPVPQNLFISTLLARYQPRPELLSRVRAARLVAVTCDGYAGRSRLCDVARCPKKAAVTRDGYACRWRFARRVAMTPTDAENAKQIPPHSAATATLRSLGSATRKLQTETSTKIASPSQTAARNG
jgi:hypothetical protein